ncbi:MAG: helix-turn-helix transcriptional regulator [Gemmatimonadota bacterium]
MTERITKLQRWLDLIAFLIGRRYPVTVDEIMEDVHAYGRGAGGGMTTDDSVRRMFERDKKELRVLGIPIETVEFSVRDAEQSSGYRLARRDFYLPYRRMIGGGPAGAGAGAPRGIDAFDIRPEEARDARDALSFAVAMPSFLLRDEARSALRKLEFDLGPGRPDALLAVDRPEAAEIRDRLRVLNDALQARKRIRFWYHGIYRSEPTDRVVSPYGLLFQGGNWYLVGHDALRDDLRVFRVDRMDEPEPNRKAPETPDYDVPDDFDLGAYRNREAWELGEGEEPALVARVRFEFPTSLWAARNAYGEPAREAADGSSVRVFRVHQVNPFLRWVLSLSGEAEILGPETLRRAYDELVQRVAALYAGNP